MHRLPNLITIVRLMLILPIAFFIVDDDFLAALIGFTVAGVSDGMDGFIARRYGWESAFGKLIDPLADKLLMITTALTLGLSGHLPVLLAMLIILKDLAVLGGVFSYTTLAGFPKISPTLLGKVTTAAQIMLLGAVLINLSYTGFLPPILMVAWTWLVAGLTALDGMSYLWLWTGRLTRDPRWQETI